MAVTKKSVAKKAAPKKTVAKKDAPKAIPVKPTETTKPLAGELVTTATLPASLDNTIHDDELRAIAERVIALKNETNWDLPIIDNQPLSGMALQEWLLKKEDQSALHRVERGIGYAMLKRELGHGAYEGWLKDNGISPQSARSDRQVAQLYFGLSNANRQRAIDLPQRKLQVLSSVPADLINDMFDTGALDHAADLSREQLRELISLRQEVEKQEEREEKLNQVIADQDEELRKRRALPESNRHALELRRAVLDETDALRANAHTLQKVLDKVALLPTDLGRAELDAIIHPLMYALQGLHATVTALHERGHRQFGYHTDIDVLPPQLSDEELARAGVQYSGFMEDAARRAIDRQLDLAVQPARKGRK